MHFTLDQLLATAHGYVQAGRFRDAATTCEQVLKTQPNNPRALFMLGFLLHQAGQWQPALERLKQATSVNPNAPEPHFLIGLIYQQQRNLPAAIAAYQQVIRLQPLYPKAMNNLGRALLDAGRVAEGIVVLRGAVNSDPRSSSAQTNLGDGLRMTGDFEGAVAAQRRAIAIDPKSAEAHSNLGTALFKCGKVAEAIQSMRKAMELNPRLPTPHYNLAKVFQDQAKFVEAIQHCRKAIELRPNYPDAVNLLGSLAGITGDVPEAIAAQRKAIELNPQHPGMHSNLLLSYHYIDELTPQQMFQEHLAWAARHGGGLARDFTGNLPQPGRRLRVGYLSPNFQHHSVAFFLEPVLIAHDRSAFEIFCYSDTARKDEVTDRLRGHAEHWRDIFGRPDAAVLDLIHQDEIDVLVDLAGHTAENRLKLFAARAAPVQVTWLGYPDTTGLATMDIRITDAVADPPGTSDTLHTEKLVRIEGGCWAYQPPANPPDVMAAPALTSGFVTFGSFNNLPKVTPTVVQSWARILTAVPTSRLLIKALGLSSDLGRETVSRHLDAAGIAGERVELLHWAPTTSSHLELYHRVDIALDTFPYNGTTTTCEALWMGVPVISFAGRSHAGRVGASLLTHTGLTELLAADLDDYTARAIALAGDIERLASLRMKLRPQFAGSPLCDGARLCRKLETIFGEITKSR